MRNLFKILKGLAAATLRRTGMMSLLIDLKLRNRVSVLMYHRIVNDAQLPTTDSSPGIIVSDTAFEFQMRTLRQHFNPISIDEFEEHLTRKMPIPPRSCLVTIDDGWIDNYDFAFPILKKYEIPAVIFVPTDYISAGNLFWQEELLMRLTWLLRSGDEAQIKVLAEILQLNKPPGLIDIEDIRNYVIRLKTSDYSYIGQHLERLRADLHPFGEFEHYNRYMTWEQVTEMSEAGISFASHAMSHRILCRLSDADCSRELTESRRIIEDKLGNDVHTITYPNGNHDQRVMKLARDAGYTIGFGTQNGLCGGDADPLSIPRMNVHGNNSRTESLFMSTCINLF